MLSEEDRRNIDNIYTPIIILGEDDLLEEQIKMFNIIVHTGKYNINQLDKNNLDYFIFHLVNKLSFNNLSLSDINNIDVPTTEPLKNGAELFSPSFHNKINQGEIKKIYIFQARLARAILIISLMKNLINVPTIYAKIALLDFLFCRKEYVNIDKNYFHIDDLSGNEQSMVNVFGNDNYIFLLDNIISVYHILDNEDLGEYYMISDNAIEQLYHDLSCYSQCINYTYNSLNDLSIKDTKVNTIPKISDEFTSFINREILIENDEFSFRGVQLINTKGYLNEFIQKYTLLENEKEYDEDIFFIGEFSKFISYKVNNNNNPDFITAIKNIIPILQEFTKPYLDKE